MEKYSCFSCPSIADYTLKELEAKCPSCGEKFGFPLIDFPEKIANIEIVKPLARGFYGATFIGEVSPFGGLKIKKVIKIIPTEIYKLHKKDFKFECENHLSISQNTNHIVDIDTNIFHESTEVIFKNGVKIYCHVIGMEYIEGLTLKEYLDNNLIIPSRSIAQISIDLIFILIELRQNSSYHNDLHPGNLLVENLSPQKLRIGEIDENIRLVAIDLGSLDQKTKSNDNSKRIGDIHWVAECLHKLSRKITDNTSYYDEKDWRLAFLLEEKADYLKPSIIAQKQISYLDLINQIKETFFEHSNPWQDELKLKNFDDSVNAQSLRPWFIPNLFVDQNDSWINSISTKGPQVITGMRGCGKTMLLRALEFHARIVPQNKEEVENKESILKRISETEGYIGLYVSCVKLLDFNSYNFEEKAEIFEPYSKLFIGYTLQAIQAIKHLRTTNNKMVRYDYFKELAMSLSSIIENSQELEFVSSEYDLETKLKKYLNSLSDGKSEHIIRIHPKIAFPQLANSIKKSSEIFDKSYIYFLLDDVSTRYLSDRNILTLVSELMFQDEYCAFKFTTEAQTLEMVIKVPGNNQQAKIGRDYTIFDLGTEVNRIIHNNHNEGKLFIEKILTKRAKYYPLHPKNYSIRQILGDKTLTSIAENIIKEERASEKKGIYSGLSALTAVCVGDLGDVITLYELMLKRNSKNEFPIPVNIQNGCFLELCNSRLYDLNRKDSKFLDFVSSFADASHHLLVQSGIRKIKGETTKLRQYTSIFINISYGDKGDQYKQIRDLIDAGIFNFYGGPEASRTNRQGLKPEQQFKLIFRKLYGINKHIGLSSADRFEISGKELFNWLSNPKIGKEILIRNLNPISEEELEEEFEKMEFEDYNSSNNNLIQAIINFPDDKNELSNKIVPTYDFVLSKLPTIEELSIIPPINFDNIVLGLGFEDSTLQSARKLSNLNKCKLILIEFDELGKQDEIINIFKTSGFENIEFIKYNDFLNFIKELKGTTIIDITGLPKSIIFDSITKAISSNKDIYLSYTEPEIEYPLDDEIKSILNTSDDINSIDLLTKVSEIIKGEQGPYTLNNLLPNYINISEPRILFSFAPLKHERLYTLLNERAFDKINIVVPNGNKPKDKLAQISAQFSLTNYNDTIIHNIPLDDISSLITILAKDYYNYFILNNFPFEIALTGSKLQTVTAAIFASSFRISQCWYIKPEKWDKAKFSKGFRSTKYYRISKKNLNFESEI